MMKDFLTSFPKNFVLSFAGKNIFWHLLAIFLTIAIVLSGLDWQYFISVRGELLNTLFFPAIFLGFFLPLLLPLGFVIYGSRRHNIKAAVYGWAMLQAAALGWIISVFYKSLTGRVQPDLLNLVTDHSHNWNFGFLEYGIFWGWPSSHTTVAFAMVTTFTVLLGKNRPAIKWLAIAYAFYIGISVSFSIHWLSEFIAGAIIGTVVGITVGKWWQKKLIQTV